MSEQPAQPNQPTFDPNDPQQATPKLRPIRGFPAQAQTPDGQPQQVLGIADAKQVSPRVVMTSPAARFILPLMDGNRSIEQILSEGSAELSKRGGGGLTKELLEGLVAQLHDAGLVEGKPFETMLAQMREDFDKATTLPPGSTQNMAEQLAKAELGEDATQEQIEELAPAKLAKQLDEWIDQALKDAENPAFDTLPKAIVAPHLDYTRGWQNYAHVYGRMRVCDRPDRVIVLGTNHFGFGTGITACDKGFESPLGTCEIDADVEKGLREKLGDKVFEHRFDHEREHSIELHIPWIQHVFGANETGTFPKVFGVLVHDPATNNGESYDGNGVALQPFVEALKETIAGLPGKTLIVASADLSHAGPAFGDQLPLMGEEQDRVQARNKVLGHDQEMIAHVKNRDAGALISAMAWQQNPTRWCSTGNLCATLMMVEPEEVDVLNYGGAMDQQGMSLVSSMAAVMR